MNRLTKFITIIILPIVVTTVSLQAGEIHEAIITGGFNKVQTFFKADPILLESKETGMGYTPLLWACDARQVAIAMFLIDKAAGNHDNDYYRFSSLSHACSGRDQDLTLIQRLIDKGGDVDWLGYNVLTPLHLTSELRVIKLLLINGAHINTFDNYKSIIETGAYRGTVIQLAINNNQNEKMAGLFIENGAKINMKDVYSNAELHLAALKGYADLTKLLIKYNADIYALNKYNRNALYYGAKHGYGSEAGALIAGGANYTQF